MDPESPQQLLSRSRSRSRSGSRSRRSDLRHHRSPRSPLGPGVGPGGDSSRGSRLGGGGGGGSAGPGSRRYEDYDSYRSASGYRDRDGRYTDYRAVDAYGRPGAGAHGTHLGAGPDTAGSRRSRSRSPMSSRRRPPLDGDRENPPAGRCVGIFGLSIYTKEADLHDVFNRYGPIDDVQIVYDAQSGRSRGFAFVYFQNVSDAALAKERCNGIEIDGRKIRVDFSLTQRAHTPTPGIYMGKSHGRNSFNNSRGTNYNNYNNSRNNNYVHNQSSRSRYPPHPSALPHSASYDRRRMSRSRSFSPRKYYY